MRAEEELEEVIVKQKARANLAKLGFLKKGEIAFEEELLRQKARAKAEGAGKLPELDQQVLEKVRQRLAEIRAERAALREHRTRQLIPLLKEIVRLQEDIRLLERKRDFRREEAERRRNEALEWLRHLEGVGGRAEAPDRSLRRSSGGSRRSKASCQNCARRCAGCGASESDSGDGGVCQKFFRFSGLCRHRLSVIAACLSS